MATPAFEPSPTSLPRHSDLSDMEAVRRVLSGEVDLFAVLMRRHNRRVFRAVRGVLKNDIEAEDAAQEAWLAAYRALHTFEGRAAFSTWLTRIAIQRAIARYRRGRPTRSLQDFAQPQPEEKRPGPESAAQRRELARVLETAIDRLPASYRMVIMLRDVEHMSTGEAAHVLEVSEENLRVRLHRARRMLRAHLQDVLGDASADVFGFDGKRCDRMVGAVMQTVLGDGSVEADRLSSPSPPT